MLDDIIEIILEIVLELIGAVWGEANIPKPVKIGLGIVVMVLVFGICGIMSY